MDKTEKMWFFGGILLCILGKYGSYYHPSSILIFLFGLFFITGSQIMKIKRKIKGD